MNTVFLQGFATSAALIIAIEVAIQPAERTLTDEDFDALTKRIIANVEKSTGGVLRG